MAAPVLTQKPLSTAESWETQQRPRTVGALYTPRLSPPQEKTPHVAAAGPRSGGNVNTGTLRGWGDGVKQNPAGRSERGLFAAGPIPGCGVERPTSDHADDQELADKVVFHIIRLTALTSRVAHRGLPGTTARGATIGATGRVAQNVPTRQACD